MPKSAAEASNRQNQGQLVIWLRPFSFSAISPPRNKLPYPGTFSRNSFSQTSASESLGARQSPRGESEPPEPTFGPLGIAERLNWLILKKRWRNTSSHFLIAGKSYSLCFSCGIKLGQSPRFLSLQA